MQKIFSTSQIRSCDAFTIVQEPIASIDLMERAASKVYQYLMQAVPHDYFEIYCGQGNNGGDGLAVARMLAQSDKKVTVYIIQVKEQGSEDFEQQLQRLKTFPGVTIKAITTGHDLVEANTSACLLDAILGTGTKGLATGIMKEAIDFFNLQNNHKIAIDVPSGLKCDEPLMQNETVVCADITLSLQFMKLAFLFVENQRYTGKVLLLDIGLSKAFIEAEKTKHFIVDLADVQRLFSARERFAHKGNFGHVFLLAGSLGKQGAALLAAKACLRSGAGLLSLHSINKVENALNVFLPSAMFEADKHPEMITEIPDLIKYNAIAIGCGIGQSAETAAALKLLIQQCKVPLVLDADAINILSNNKTWLSFLPGGTILTPHPKEFERLCGKWNNSFERLQMQKDFSSKYNCFVVFKGAYTCISTPLGNCYFNPTGNAGMAKGGSGDTLTGIIAALLAQGISKAEACIAGVYLHGLAGDLAKETHGEISMLPEDLIAHLGAAFKVVAAGKA